MSQRPHDEAFGLSRREQQIMARLDAGANRADVARDFGVAESHVDYLQQQYGYASGARPDAFEQATRHSMRLYGEALARSGGRFR